MRNELLQLSARELGKKIRSREISSEEVVRCHIDRIEKTNPLLNAVVQRRFEVALEEARYADRLIDVQADLPILHGVPCTIKECFAVQGMPQSSGLVARKHIVAMEDAPTVFLMRHAGLIPLGVTNLSELCMWMESNNKVYGRTNNPYDLKRTCGGSSGGEGACVGSGASPVGLGSDIGGSIRMPAFFNGVFGHKPSPGIVSNIGQYPIAANEALNYLSTGPICRKAEDLPLLCNILAGRNADRLSAEEVDLSTLKVLHIPDDGRIPVSQELKAVQLQAAEHLASLGADVEEIRISGLRRSVEVWSAMLEAAGGHRFEELLFDGQKNSFVWQLCRHVIGRGAHTVPALGLVLLEKISKLRPESLQQFIDLGQALQLEFRRHLQGNTIVLYPSHTQVAPKHSRSLLTPWNWAYTAIVNVLKLPATQVPLGLNAEGLPLGIQVIANEGQDHRCFAVAMELERAFGGWVYPSHL